MDNRTENATHLPDSNAALAARRDLKARLAVWGAHMHLYMYVFASLLYSTLEPKRYSQDFPNPKTGPESHPSHSVDCKHIAVKRY